MYQEKNRVEEEEDKGTVLLLKSRDENLHEVKSEREVVEEKHLCTSITCSFLFRHTVDKKCSVTPWLRCNFLAEVKHREGRSPQRRIAGDGAALRGRL
jgi:hypothetical protein